MSEVKQLNEMTNAEFYIQVARVIEAMGTALIKSHSALAKCYEDKPDDTSADALLYHSAGSVMEALGDVCGNIDLDDDGWDWMGPIFDEWHRREDLYLGTTGRDEPDGVDLMELDS